MLCTTIDALDGVETGPSEALVSNERTQRKA